MSKECLQGYADWLEVTAKRRVHRTTVAGAFHRVAIGLGAASEVGVASVLAAVLGPLSLQYPDLPVSSVAMHPTVLRTLIGGFTMTMITHHLELQAVALARKTVEAPLRVLGYRLELTFFPALLDHSDGMIPVSTWALPTLAKSVRAVCDRKDSVTA